MPLDDDLHRRIPMRKAVHGFEASLNSFSGGGRSSDGLDKFGFELCEGKQTRWNRGSLVKAEATVGRHSLGCT
jgi:hypothetical protein